MTTNIIRRYAVSGDIAYPIHEDPEGDCVTYEDHVAAIEPYAKRIAELEAQLEAIGAGGVTQEQRLFADRKRRGESQEPFGYFRALPFGWTDCAATDEGAIALYERPQEQGEPVAWLYEDELPDNYPYEAMFAYSKVNGVRMFPVYAPQPAEPVACFKCGHSKHGGECVNVAPQPSEPEHSGWYCAHCQRGVDSSEVTFHEQHLECGRVITDDSPPQPAEPSGAPTLHNADRGAQNGIQATQPAEPVRVLPSDGDLITCAGVSTHGDMPAIFGTADIRRFTECVLKHFAKNANEPVKEVSDDLLNALRAYEQASMDGSLVKVSHQALDEAIALLAGYGQPAAMEKQK